MRTTNYAQYDRPTCSAAEDISDATERALKRQYHR